MAKKSSISIVNFNTMGLFSFDTWRGFAFSMRIRQRQEKIAEILFEDDSDIIALQEVHTYGFLNLLKTKLKKHPYAAYKKLLYGPRGSLVIFSKIPLDSVEYVDFTDRGSVFNTSIVAILRRSGMLIVRLKNENVYIINAHLTQNGDFVWNNKSRFYPYIRSQLAQITKRVKTLSSPDTDIVVLGDFNTDKKSALYKSFLRVSNLSDVFKEIDTPTLHQEFLPLKKVARRIDYIFLHDDKRKAKIIDKSEMFDEKYILGKKRIAHISDHIGQKAIIEFLAVYLFNLSSFTSHLSFPMLI